jgi:hypothetical protein
MSVENRTNIDLKSNVYVKRSNLTFKTVNNKRCVEIIKVLINLINLDGNFPSRMNIENENIIIYAINE